MRFRETPIFTTEILRLLDDEHYRRLQLALLLRPEQGPVIQRSGGLRKLRWSTTGRGKRGGIRVIYYWDRKSQAIYMLFAYSKSSKDDLTPSQLRILRQVVREEFE